MLKSLLRRIAQACGYKISKLGPPPPGQDWIVDLQRLLRGQKAPVLFDVGANVGAVAARLAAAFPAPATIYAFEPAGATFAQLAAAVVGYSHVRPLQLALAEKAGRRQLHHSQNSQLNRLGEVGALGTGTQEAVEVATLDQIAEQFALSRIDVIKTDTEGFDAAVLRGATGLLERGAIRAIVSEATFDAGSPLHTAFDEIRALLEPRGFCLHNFYECDHWNLRLKYCNVLFLREASFPATEASPA